MAVWIPCRHEQKMKKKQIYFAARILLGLIFLEVLFWKIGFQNFAEQLSKFNPVFFLYIAPLMVINFFVGGLNIKLLLRPINKDVKLSRITRYTTLSWAYGLLVPGKIGEFSIIAYLKKEKASYGEGLAISILDKIITILVISVFALIGVAKYFNVYSAWRMAAFLAVAMAVFVRLIYSEKVRMLIRKFVLRKHDEKFTGFFRLSKDYVIKHPELILVNIFFTLVKFAIVSLIFYLIALGFGIQLNFMDVAMINAAAILISLVPITISGLGIREAGIVYMLGLVGIASAAALGISLIVLFVNYASCAIALFSMRID